MSDINRTSPTTDFDVVARQAELADEMLDKQEIRTAQEQTARYHTKLALEEILENQPSTERSKDSRLAAILSKHMRV